MAQREQAQLTPEQLRDALARLLVDVAKKKAARKRQK